jgi:hypothetical protein
MPGTGYSRVFSSGENLMAYLGRLEEQGYPYDHVQVRHCLGDNGAPDVNFADAVREWNATHAYPKLVIATTAGMFRDFEKRYGESIPSAKGDFTPYWEDGAASSARETALNRRSADRLLQAESLYAMLQPKAYRAEDFYHAWRNVVLYDEHTWGAHNSISEPDHPFVKSQWAIKQAFALDGEKQSRALIQKANESRGGKPEAPSGGPMDLIDVINTTGNNIASALIVVPPELSRAGNVVRSSLASEEGRPSQRLTTGELVFVSCWPAFTARRLYVTPGTKTYPVQNPARAEGTTLSTKAASRDIALRLDATTGAIASLVVNGRELVDPKASTALNDYLYLPGSDASRLERNGPVKISVKEQGPLVASLLVESAAPGARNLTREVRLVFPRGQIEIIDTVDKTAVRAKEGVHFGFGFQVPDGTVRMDVPWAIVRPELDQIPGACKNWFTIQRWVDISGPSSGVTWISPDAPLVEVGGLTADRIGSLSDPNQWIGRLEPSQTIYSWVMNNHWHTNYRAEQEGPTTFRYVIVPHQGRFEATTAAARAREVCQPILVLPARGEIPKEAPLSIRGKRDGGPFQITTFKPSDDGKAWIVRFQNLSETTDEAQLTWRAPGPKAIWMSDNSERPIAPAKAAIECGPWSIVTIRADMP